MTKLIKQNTYSYSVLIVDPLTEKRNLQHFSTLIEAVIFLSSKGIDSSEIYLGLEVADENQNNCIDFGMSGKLIFTSNYFCGGENVSMS